MQEKKEKSAEWVKGMMVMVDDNLWHFQSGIIARRSQEDSVLFRVSESRGEIYGRKKLGILLKITSLSPLSPHPWNPFFFRDPFNDNFLKP